MAEPEAEVSLTETIDKALGLLRRRRWWIGAPACLIALATIVVLYLLPNQYTSQATILVVQQQIPERYVVPTATTDISKALQAMTEEVLSRTRLLEIINEFGLYVDERKRLAPEELMERMRKDVSITPLESNPERREVNAFEIAFVAQSPEVAQQVTKRLTTLFIEQNLKRREDQAKTTTRFLGEQLTAVKTKLAEEEQRVRDFKMGHLGELPEQQAGNLGILTGLQSQLENVMGNLNRSQQQRLYLESLLGEYRRLAQRRIPIVGASGAPQLLSPVEAAQRDLAVLETESARLLTQYTPQHPDVIKKTREIAQQKELIKTLAAAQPAGEQAKGAEKQASSNQQTPSAESMENSAATAQLRSQLEANQLETENLKRTETKLRSDIEHYQARLNQTPVREQQLASMMRDLELMRANYADLLKKEQESQLATSLEKRQEGQQFRLVDPPNLPTIPSRPKRLKISLGGIAGGLAFGLALGFLFEMRDTSFHSEKDAIDRLKLPLVVGIPQIFTPSEQRKLFWQRSLEWLAATAMTVAVCAAEYYVYRNQ